MQPGNTSGLLGVHFCKRDQLWISRIGAGGFRKHLGVSKDLFSAACLRKSAENKYGYHKNHGATGWKE